MLAKHLGILLITALLATLLPAMSAKAANNWGRGNTVGLCSGTQIRHGPGSGWSVHTIVPENNWPVKVIDGPRYGEGQTWWDTSRREIDGGGTGWVAQSDADRCFSSPPPQPPSQPNPTPQPGLAPQPVPTPPPPSPNTCTSVRLQSREYCGPWINIRHALYYYTYNQDCGGVDGGGSYCENQVNIGADGVSFRSGSFEVALDQETKKPLQVGVGYYPLDEVGVVGGPALPLGYWRGLKLTAPVRWKDMLSVDFSYVFRHGVQLKPLEILVSVVVAAFIALVVIAAWEAVVAAAGLKLSGEALAAFALFVTSFYGVPTTPTTVASIPPTTMEVSHADLDPSLVEMLRQSYGPLVDKVNLRPFHASEPLVSSSGLNAESLVEFHADGFAPGADVVVVMDRGGKIIAEKSLTATPGGEVGGTISLSAHEATTPGILTIIALEEQQVFAQLNALVGAVAASSVMDVAAASVTVAPAPRLTSEITFDPWPIVAGRPTTATYTVQNYGDVAITLKQLVLAIRGPIGPNCPDWCDNYGADWPSDFDITLPPGGTHTVSTQRVIPQSGEYKAVIAYRDIQDQWHDADASSRFPIQVQPGITIQDQLTISPTGPLAGDMVTFRFKVKNESSEPLKLAQLVAAGRGPDCSDGMECDKWIDAPSVRNLHLAPGQEYIYLQRRLVMHPGDYFYEPAYLFSDPYWLPVGSRLDFRVGPGIRVVQPLQLTPPDPVTGEPVSATYTIRNEGSRAITLPYLGAVARGPNCAGSSWECEAYADWPWYGDVKIESQQEYTYRGVRSLANAGSGYWIEPQFADKNPWWLLIAGGERTDFVVQPGIDLVSPLQLIPNDPVVGETVEVSATIKNSSDRPLTLSRLFVGVQGPNCTDFSCSQSDPNKWGDFPPDTNLTIMPGDSYTYNSSRMWLNQGSDYIAQLMYQVGLDDWHVLGNVRQFAVGEGLEFVKGLTITPPHPEPNQLYEGTFSLINNGRRDIILPALGVGGRDADCDDERCHNNAGMAAFFNITIPVGGRYDYVAERSIDTPGTYFVEPSIIVADLPDEDWWMPLTPLTHGDRITFTVGNIAPPVTDLPPCSMTIERGATFVNTRDVHVSLNVPGASELLVSNDGGFVDGVRMPYISGFDWTLVDTGERVSTLVVRIRAFEEDGERLCEGDLSDEIILDPLPPSVAATWTPAAQIRAANSTTDSAQPGVLLVEAQDQLDGSGVVAMQVSHRPDFPDPAWETFQSSRSFETDGASTIYVRVRDRAGNVSESVSVSIEDVKPVYAPYVNR